MDKLTPTPTPWEVSRHDDNGEIVIRSILDTGIVANCQCDSYIPNEQRIANAELIAKCVNFHDELIASLKRVKNQFQLRYDQSDECINVDGTYIPNPAIEEAEELIAKLDK
jgi:hypothetical protein